MSKYKQIFIVLIIAVFVVSSVAVSKTLAKNLIIADTPEDNVGIGTSLPQFKLEVDGFVNTKTDREISTQGLRMGMNFNSGSINGTKILDSSGYNNHGEAIGVTQMSDGPENNSGYLQFNGGISSGDYINLDSSYTIDLTDATIAFWVKRDSLTSQDTTNSAEALRILWGSGSYKFLDYRISGGNFQFRGERDVNSTYWALISSNVSADLNWHHVVITAKDNVVKLFMDGKYQGQDDDSGAGYGTNEVTFSAIGRGYGSAHSTYGEYMQGGLDDFRVYDRALSDDEAVALYLQRKEVFNAYVDQKDVFVNNLGELGIGTTNLTDTLTVNGSGYFLDPITIGSPVNTNHAATKSYVDSSISDVVAGSTYWTPNGSNIYNNNGGNVGIGTTSPSHLLNLQGSSGETVLRLAGSNAADGADIVKLQLDRGFSSTSKGAEIATYRDGGDYDYNGLKFRVHSSADPDDASIDAMTIDSSGNVGIGTISPGVKLDVNGTGRFVNNLIVPTPVSGSHATTKDYVDGLASKWNTSGNNIYNNNSGNVSIGTSAVDSINYGTGGTVLHVSDPTDNEMTQLYVGGDGQGTGYVLVGQNTSYGGGITYNGDDTPDMPQGSDHFSLFVRSGGVDTEVLHWSHNSTIAQFEGNIDMNSHSITNLGSPVNSGDATTKSYVDSTIATSIGGSTYWNLNGSDIYNSNGGNVGIGTSTPRGDFDISGYKSINRIQSSHSWTGLADNNPDFIPLGAFRTESNIQISLDLTGCGLGGSGLNYLINYGYNGNPRVYYLGPSSYRNAPEGLGEKVTFYYNQIDANDYYLGVETTGGCSDSSMTTRATLEVFGPANYDKIDSNQTNYTIATTYPYIYNGYEGNVGIGTTNPREKLEVDGSMLLSYIGDYAGTDQYKVSLSDGMEGSATIGSGGLIIKSEPVSGGTGTSSSASFRLLPFGDSIYFQNTNSSGDIYFSGLNGADLQGDIIFKGSGNVGIGTTSPGAKLEVDGTGSFSGTVSVATPISGSHATTKDYVDSAITPITNDQYVNESGDAMTGSLNMNIPTSIFFENGKHLISYNDGHGNFNIRVGQDNNEIVTEGGYVSHMEWSQSGGWWRLNWDPSSKNIGDTISWGNYLEFNRNGDLNVNGSSVWHVGNDGSGSGLSADNLDSIDSGAFLRSNTNDTFTGKLTASDSNRQSGIYGTYNSTKIDHIWSVGTAYDIASDGSNFGNLYGLAYKHTNNPTGGTMAGGHQMVWNINGVPQAALGDNGVWTSGDILADSGSVSAISGDFSGSISVGTVTNSNHAATKNYVDSALTSLTTKNEVTNLGTVSFANSTSTDNFILELESKGAFDNYHSIMKASWSYAGNDNILDTGYGSFELAGSVIETWTDNDSNTTRGNIHVRVTRPTTGSGGGQILVYNNQGSGYSPGWRQIWTSTTDGSGSGLDADTVDGLHGSAFMPAGTDNWVNEGGDTMSGELNMGDNEITYVGNLDISDGDGRGIKFWNGSSSYALYMSDADPDLGGVTGYSLTSKMSNTDGRGFRWCNTNNECGMSLESFTGQWDLTVSNDVNVGGDVTATAYYYSSDKRLKDNIVSLGGESLEVLDKLNPVSFTWKEDGSASQGFLAQEIEQVLPELVKTNSETGMKAVQYGNLTAVLTAGIKEQQKEIERLENKIEILETKLDILLKR